MAATFNVYPANMNLLPFIFVGCWNEKGEPHIQMIDAIERSRINNLVLGGDNFYPEKIGKGDDKVKTFNSGLLTTPIFAKKHVVTALGNHNIESGMSKTGEHVDVLLLERAHQTWHIPGGPPYYFIMRYNDVELMILDTNIIDDDEQFNEMIECIRSYNPTRPYYCVMHEPIFSAKQKIKDGKIKSFYHQMTKGKEILEALCSKPPIAILCADTHNYHQVDISCGRSTITQIVVGTGGASPDPVNWDLYKSSIDRDGISYTIIPPIDNDKKHLSEQNKFGFIVIDELGKHTFVPVLGWASKGGRQKSRTTRRKRDGRRQRSKRRQ
jgi:hypothetical protein